MSIRWCLGFVFSTDLRQVVLLRKGKSLHVGLWNGLGGALEKDDLGSSMNAMVRECKEESGLDISLTRWTDVGKLIGGNDSWQVDIFSTKLRPEESAFLASIDEEVVWTCPSRIFEFHYDVAVMMPVSVLPRLAYAPHMGTLVHASLEALRDLNVPKLMILSNP
jgi:8-oxo-dGTP pyrophosphatase MutT (NUDIX family)